MKASCLWSQACDVYRASQHVYSCYNIRICLASRLQHLEDVDRLNVGVAHLNEPPEGRVVLAQVLVSSYLRMGQRASCTEQPAKSSIATVTEFLCTKASLQSSAMRMRWPPDRFLK